MTNTLKTVRFDTGCYRTTDGRFEIQSMAYNTEGASNEKAWILFDRKAQENWEDGYCGHYATKRDAVRGAFLMALEELTEEEERVFDMIDASHMGCSVEKLTRT